MFCEFSEILENKKKPHRVSLKLRNHRVRWVYDDDLSEILATYTHVGEQNALYSSGFHLDSIFRTWRMMLGSSTSFRARRSKLEERASEEPKITTQFEQLRRFDNSSKYISWWSPTNMYKPERDFLTTNLHNPWMPTFVVTKQQSNYFFRSTLSSSSSLLELEYVII